MTRIRIGNSSEPVSPCSEAESLRRWDGVRQHLWWCSFARIDGEGFIGCSPLSQNWRVEIRVTASVFAATKERHQLMGGKPRSEKKKINKYACWRVDYLLVQRYVICKTYDLCTMQVRERLNICWDCFADTADFLNICLQTRLSNRVPRTARKLTRRQNLPRLRWPFILTYLVESVLYPPACCTSQSQTSSEDIWTGCW